MTKDKYVGIVQQEFDKLGFVDFSNPEVWTEVKGKLLVVIEGIDKAYEVYQMENTSKAVK